MESKVSSWFHFWCLSRLVEQGLTDGALLCRRQGEHWRPLLAAGMALPDNLPGGPDSRPLQRLNREHCQALDMAGGRFVSLAPLQADTGLFLYWRQPRSRPGQGAWLAFVVSVFMQRDRGHMAQSLLPLFEHVPLPLTRIGVDGEPDWANRAARMQHQAGTAPADHQPLSQRLQDDPELGMAVLEQCHDKPRRRVTETVLIPVRDERGRLLCLMRAEACLTRRASASGEAGVRFVPAPEQPEGVMICDGSSRILDVSPAFEQVTGYDREQVLGRYPSLLRSGLHSREFYVRMNRALREQGDWSGEVWNRRRSGQVYPERLSVRTLHGPGNSRRYVAVLSEMGQPLAAGQMMPPEEKDSLTGLCNRSGFQQRLADWCRHREPFALMILDINNFRLFNNAMNHRVGDRVLQEVAQRLQGRLREGDLLARIGSDEFALLVPGIVHHRQARIFGRHLLSGLARPLLLAEQQLYVDATLGGALWPGVAEQDAESLLQHAEQALFGAKQKKEPLALYDDQLNRAQSRRIRLQHDLVEAIHQGGLSLHYQPIVDTATGRVSKLEALVRWRHAELGPISPVEFVPVAEESGMVQALGDWVLNQACTDLGRLLQAGHDLTMAINRSSLEFQSLGLDGNEWLSIIERHGLEPGHIIFEITESLFMQGSEHHLDRIHALRQAGCRIAIDDFGTGYSALNYLRAFPIDMVKIDKSFIDHLPGNQKDGLLLEGILRIIGDLGMKVVIEGMETQAQAAYLSTQPCHFLQGYLIARPMPLGELLAFLESYDGHALPPAT